MKECIAVSACLLGANTKYSGDSNLKLEIYEIAKGKTILVICPEVFGGLTTPRDPSEQILNKVQSDKGRDVTLEFELGAKRTLDFLKRNNCNTVILKNGSPSCGNYSYDGTFTHTKVDKMGVTAKLLKDNGFNLIYLD